jgi:hypothetical protein
VVFKLTFDENLGITPDRLLLETSRSWSCGKVVRLGGIEPFKEFPASVKFTKLVKLENAGAMVPVKLKFQISKLTIFSL